MVYMKVHQMKLSLVPFNKIKDGTKKIESRIYDEKRRMIEIGDIVIFSENDNEDNKVKTEVVGLLRYRNFKELFEDHNPSLFGEDSVDFLTNQINAFYKKEEQEEFGVIGLRLNKID